MINKTVEINRNTLFPFRAESHTRYVLTEPLTVRGNRLYYCVGDVHHSEFDFSKGIELVKP